MSSAFFPPLLFPSLTLELGDVYLLATYTTLYLWQVFIGLHMSSRLLPIPH